MSKFEIYRLLHMASVYTLIFSFGSLFIGKNYNKGAAIAHGIALIVILVSGFGMHAVLHLGFPTWLLLKIGIWIIFGGLIILAKKSIINGLVAWICIIALSLSAFYLAKHHPKIGVKAKVTETK
jgi:hypothetical protein